MKLKNVLNIEQFADHAVLEQIHSLADKLMAQDKNGGMEPVLKGKIIALLFFEPSTRTRLSFSSAALKLGAQIITMENGMVSSSAAKGESIEDTIEMLNGYADAIIMRHPMEGASKRAAAAATVPYINGGDGGKEHPTQALYDAYTIHKEVGRLDNLHIAFGFDPLQSRTIRSLAILLSTYAGNHFTFVSPSNLRAAPDFLKQLRDNGATCDETEDIKTFSDADVLYTNRLQEERFSDHATFEKLRHVYRLTPDMITSKNKLILNPLPRIDEVSVEVDKLPIAGYFRNARNGVYVRAALLYKLFID